MKVFELAKELTVQSKEIVSLLKESGEENASHMTVLTDEQIEQIYEFLFSVLFTLYVF